MAALLAAMLVSVALPAPVAARGPAPKVALVVGPVGDVTPFYRRLANEAADAARASGARVVKVYSPNATWPAVRSAISGASIVVYLGHGNGWPSRYRDSLYPPSQNGFGLNPVAGVDDAAHQYFGEARVDDVRLAPNAVVLLHHLCYASGNTEPGLPEGTREQAIQRVDNYAAGFLRAGAQAVVAEAHLGPAWYVRELLGTNGSVEAVWSRSPNARGNVFEVASERTRGYTVRLDPDREHSGFHRSLVSRGVTALAMRRSATGRASTPAPRTASSQPSLARAGIRFGPASLEAAPVADRRNRLVLPLAAGGLAAPEGTKLGVRWDPLVLDPVLPALPPDARVPGPGLAAAAPDLQAPPVELVVPERLGTVVDLAVARRRGDALGARVTPPATPGLYRVVITIHQRSGVAYDGATQDLVAPFIVRVGAPVSVAYGVPPSVVMTTGSPAVVPVRVVNTGGADWTRKTGGGLISRLPASLVATWLSPDGLPVPPRVTTVVNADETVPGGGTSVPVHLVAPARGGEYLLLLDVVSPAHGALSRLGSAPGIVRVAVAVADPATATPAPAREDVRGE